MTNSNLESTVNRDIYRKVTFCFLSKKNTKNYLLLNKTIALPILIQITRLINPLSVEERIIRNYTQND